MASPIIVWFRRDLRVGDNPALTAAARSGQPVIALYIDETKTERSLGGASKWWLHQSLSALQNDLTKLGVSLTLRKGETETILSDIVKETGADHIVWNRRYAARAVEQDTQLKSHFSSQGLKLQTFKANLLNEPWDVQTGSGGYYKVFSPYWRAVLRTQPPEPPLPVPSKLISGPVLKSLNLSDFGLLPTHPDWASKMKPYWTPGADGAHQALMKFLDGPMKTYKDDRNRPDKLGTSKLSPHLAFGEISPRQIWYLAQSADCNPDKFLSEIGWREFSYALLFYNPDLKSKNFKPDFDAFEWQNDDVALERWQKGQTGYPFVDAGMRELWETGWQHNRVRMVTASFLIKHLLQDWRSGEAWFWDTLLDADPANNAASWQWVAGSGADAAPYFRIFNPFTQGEKFDPDGDYVRKWVPELARLPNKFLNRPWEAPELVLMEAGVELGQTYPKPIVDHKVARERALEAYKATRS